MSTSFIVTCLGMGPSFFGLYLIFAGMGYQRIQLPEACTSLKYYWSKKIKLVTGEQSSSVIVNELLVRRFKSVFHSIKASFCVTEKERKG